MLVEFQNHLMPDFDWDGFNLFVFNTSKRNNGWGEVYIYSWESHKPTQIRPISQKCCYCDVRWSPDGTYLIFAFQDEGSPRQPLPFCIMFLTAKLEQELISPPFHCPKASLKTQRKRRNQLCILRNNQILVERYCSTRIFLTSPGP